MTNENIIKQLKRLIPSLQYADDVNAVKGAIQALEKENIYDDGEHYVTISKALYDKLNTDYEALSQEPMREFTEEEAKAYSKALDKMYKPTGFNVFNEPCDTISRILQRMWNCRGKHTTSIDKVKMEQIIREELSSVTKKTLECNDTVSRGVFEQVMRERDIAIEQLHELGYELGQKIEPLEVEAAKLQQEYNKGFDDCRQAVLEAFKPRGIAEDVWQECHAYRVLSSLPSVRPKSETVTEFADRCRECGARYGKLLKQKTGHWIYDETIENWRCSKCNETPKTMGYVGTADFMAEHFKFCNHCGCRMVEPQERSDKE